MTNANPCQPQRARNAPSRPGTTIHIRAKLDHLDTRATGIVLGLTRLGTVFDSPKFAGNLTEIGTALADFGVDLGAPHLSADDGVTLSEPLLSTPERANFPLNRQQTLQVLRVLERSKCLFDTVADATAKRQRTVALSELTTAAAVYGQRLGLTAQLLTVRRHHRAQRPASEIAAELGITEPEVEQMLEEAQALVDGPLEHPAPPPWRPCPGPVSTTEGRRLR